MSLPSKQKLPDIYLNEFEVYRSIAQNKDRTTSGQFSFTSTSSGVSYTTLGSVYDSMGANGMMLLLYNVNPILKSYIFDDQTYSLIKTTLDTNSASITSLQEDVDNVTTAISDTGTVNNLVVNTIGTFDLTKNKNVTPFIIPLFTNTSATVNINLDGQGNKLIKKANDTGTLVSLEAGDIKKNVPIQLVWDSVSDFFIFAPKGGSNIKSIQRGTLNFSTSNTTENVTITSVDLTKSILMFSHDTSGSQWVTGSVSGIFTTSTNIQFTRYSSSGSPTARVRWQVIEFNNVKSLQSGSLNYTGTSSNVTITSVDLTKAIIFANYRINQGIESLNRMISYGLANSTTINLTSDQSVPASVFNWSVIQFN